MIRLRSSPADFSVNRSMAQATRVTGTPGRGLAQVRPPLLLVATLRFCPLICRQSIRIRLSANSISWASLHQSPPGNNAPRWNVLPWSSLKITNPFHGPPTGLPDASLRPVVFDTGAISRPVPS